MVSEFKRLCNFINKHEDIHRTELNGSEGFNMITVDPYRRKLTSVGYISSTQIPGVYKRIKKIPENYTTTKLKEQYAKSVQLRRMNEDKYPV